MMKDNETEKLYMVMSEFWSFLSSDCISYVPLANSQCFWSVFETDQNPVHSDTLVSNKIFQTILVAGSSLESYVQPCLTSS